MFRLHLARALPWLVLVALTATCSCRTLEPGKSAKPEAPPELTPTVLDYVDGDAFDALLETALVNQDPAIVVLTRRTMPDWGDRLNAWIAAWNHGGRARARTARGQASLPRVVIDGDSIREFRLLVNGLLDRIDEAATAGSAWYRDQRERSRRVALLRPYSLRFHKGEDGAIQLIFFHGKHAGAYPQFIQKLMNASTPEGEWTRSVECSQAAGPKRADRLTRATVTE
jgi:hypothetical protein